MIQGINQLPVTGGHLYLGYDPAYVRRNHAELVRNNGGEPTVWRDILWEFQALGDADSALAGLRAAGGYTPEEGESRAHTFHWVRNLAALGTVDTGVTANHPLAAVFTRNGQRTYVAANPSGTARTVTFSDGTSLAVPAGRTATTGAYQWSGGSAGGVEPSPSPTTPGPTPSPTATASPTPTPTPTPSPTSPTPSPTSPASPTRYLLAGGGLAGPAGSAGTAVVVAANGNHDGTPTNPLVFTATGLNLGYSGGATGFDLFLDAGSAVGNGVQARISYDLTGDGTPDRVETYRYFATDPVAGYEHYTQAAGTLSATGTLGDLRNGTVRVEVWSAIGASPTTLGVGNQSLVRLPYA
ncbi:hypothetical protein [Plantactinospora sp. KBS50]|uniref:hypothetical protein n=1 Tax=Plantactinospora sp. KBS50 TaxID=2024580 RepID=UPI001E537226|nr:hypothetical protein [Plantactinospora sp. KBS50]